MQCSPNSPTQPISCWEIAHLHCHALMMVSYPCIQITNKPAEIQLHTLPQKSEVYFKNYAAHF